MYNVLAIERNPNSLKLICNVLSTKETNLAWVQMWIPFKKTLKMNASKKKQVTERY